MGDGSRFENSRAMSLEGSTRAPTRSVGPFRFVLLADRQRRQPSKLNRRVRFPQSTLMSVRHALGDRLTVGRLALNQAMEVRFLLPELPETHSGVAAAGSGAWL